MSRPRTHIAALAQVTSAKFGRLRLAADLIGAGVLLLAAGVVAGAIS